MITKFIPLAVEQTLEIMYITLQWKQEKHWLSCLLHPSHILVLTQDGEWSSLKGKEKGISFTIGASHKRIDIFRAGVRCFVYFCTSGHINNLMRWERKLDCTDFALSQTPWGIFNIIFSGQYLKDVLNIGKHALLLSMSIFVVLEKDCVIFNLLTDSAEIIN